MIDGSFYPDCKRAVAIDQRMREQLADSLEYVKSRIKQQSTDHTLVESAERLAEVSAFLRSNNRTCPAVFGYYYQLVFSIFNGNTLELALNLDRLVSVLKTVNQLVVKDLSASGLGNDDLVLLYQKCLDTEDNIKYGFLPPLPADSNRTRQSIERAFVLMEKIMPELAAEIRAIIIEILLASSRVIPGFPEFSGASSYQLWGAMAFNAGNEKTDIDMLLSLVHEACHSFLFGLTIDEPMVFNPDEQLFKSPLRDDPRPMDGIYHATYVSARMCYALLQLLDSPALDNTQKQEYEPVLYQLRDSFYGGYEVVSSRADLSATGRAVMQNACEYMEQVIC